MKFYPKNRHLLVEPKKLEEEKEEIGFVLPDDYKKAPEPYQLVTILGVAPDADTTYKEGDTALIEGSMLKNAKVGIVSVYLIQENYILGTIKGGEVA